MPPGTGGRDSASPAIGERNNQLGSEHLSFEYGPTYFDSLKFFGWLDKSVLGQVFCSFLSFADA